MICFIVEVILNARHVLIKMLNQSIRDPTSKNDHEEHQEDEQDDDFILLKSLHRASNHERIKTISVLLQYPKNTVDNP